jgi:hypothetical protein
MLDAAVSVFCLVYIGFTLLALPGSARRSQRPLAGNVSALRGLGGRHRGVLCGPDLGRHKMAPRLSPNKTWEGAAAFGSRQPACGRRIARPGTSARSPLRLGQTLVSRTGLVLAGAGSLGKPGRRRWAIWPSRRSNDRWASRTPARCCPATAACWTASTPCCWRPRCCGTLR